MVNGKLLEATDAAWTHWLPNQPTSPHWYTPEKLRTLISLMLNNERRGGKARSVNEFVREFHGLSSTVKAKAITSQAGLTGAMLHDLIVSNDVDMNKVTALLHAMQTHAKVVKPEALGVLGKEHCQTRLVRYGAAPDSVEYRKTSGEANGLPYVLEVAFGIKTDSKYSRTLRTGINFSPALAQPFTALGAAMENAHCQNLDPVVMLVHLSCPAVEFSDRGKSKAILPLAMEVELQRMVKQVTARFTKAKRQADRNDRISARDTEELLNAHKERLMTVKEAAYQVMERAYIKASSNNTLPANARQIMYVARPLIIRLTGKSDPWSNDAYFTQKLLPNFIAEHPELCQDWDVVFDDRGHFEEPHTNKQFGVGTLAVRDYIRGWETDVDNLDVPDRLATKLPTKGPALRYQYALFIEKEGFAPLIGEAHIAERYDLAIMSTKGMSVTAARQLVETLSQEGVTLFVLHDFDRSGFTILHTIFNDTRRYQFKVTPKVIDLGLRLADVKAMKLDSERVDYRSTDPRPNLLKSGATAAEIAFLVDEPTVAKAGDNETDDDSDDDNDDDDARKTDDTKKKPYFTGKRVELNAMDSATFIEWLEGKLKQHGVTKLVPDKDNLHVAWKRAWRLAELNKLIKEAEKNLPEAPEPPNDLRKQVTDRLEEFPILAWDEVLLEEEDDEDEAIKKAA